MLKNAKNVKTIMRKKFAKNVKYHFSQLYHFSLVLMTKNVKRFNIFSNGFRGASTNVIKCRPSIRKMLKNAKTVKTKMRKISRKMLKLSVFAVLTVFFGTDGKNILEVLTFFRRFSAELRRKMLNDAL